MTDSKSSAERDTQPPAAAQQRSADPLQTTSTRAAGRAILKLAKHLWLTNLLLVIAAALTLLTDFGQNSRTLDPLLIVTHTGIGLSQVAAGELWRLVTPIFLHFTWPHLICNGYAMFFLGGAVELRRGRWYLLALVVVTGAYSNIAQLLVSGNGFFGGLSGVIFALFGYLWIAGVCAADRSERLPPRFVKLALLSFAACFPISWLGFPIANTAHAAGLILGMLWALADNLVRRQQWPDAGV